MNERHEVKRTLQVSLAAAVMIAIAGWVQFDQNPLLVFAVAFVGICGAILALADAGDPKRRR